MEQHQELNTNPRSSNSAKSHFIHYIEVLKFLQVLSAKSQAPLFVTLADSYLTARDSEVHVMTTLCIAVANISQQARRAFGS